MVDKTKITSRAASLSKVEDKQPDEGAFAQEIPSNEYVVGNLNSQSLYRVTPEKDNGMGVMKEASNKYLVKIAETHENKDQPNKLRALGRGVAHGAVGGVAGSIYGAMRKDKEHGVLAGILAGSIVGGMHGYGLSIINQTKKIKERELKKEAGVGSWMRGLGSDIKQAGPLAHITLGTSMFGTGLSVTRTVSSTGMAKRDMERSQREKNSLKALNGINKAISTNDLDRSSMAVQRPKGM